MEKRAYSYCVKNFVASSGGLTRPKDVSRLRYSRMPIVRGLCSNATTCASGSGGVSCSTCRWSSTAGSRGARDTALASMRFGSSVMTFQYWRFAKSTDEGDPHPGCDTWPHGGDLADTGMIVALQPWLRRLNEKLFRPVECPLLSASSSHSTSPDRSRGLESQAIIALLLNAFTIMRLTSLPTSPSSIGMYGFGIACSTVRFV